LLTYIIHMLGGVLKKSKDESERSNAAEILLAYYRRYRESKQGEEIRMYEGTYIRTDGKSYHTGEYEQRDCHAGICSDGVYTDSHTDTIRTINFSTKNA
jgi:hypothetical protein